MRGSSPILVRGSCHVSSRGLWSHEPYVGKECLLMSKLESNLCVYFRLTRFSGEQGMSDRFSLENPLCKRCLT